MKSLIRIVLLLAAVAASPLSSSAADAQILGWNNLGMHCMDSDYSVFSILPPYNTIEAQLIVNGQLVTASNGYTVTYEAMADPDGSFNSTSVGKSNFENYDQALYGADLPPEVGLLGWAMPGVSNVPQPMRFETFNQPAPGVFTPVNWFHAEGIPITPFDDAGNKNPYPLMRLIARNPAHQPIATNDIVLPVSDEMDCRACHASGTSAAAQPAAGWVWSANPEKDYRLNILALHDERRDPDTYPALLASAGFNAQGLFRSVVADGQPVLCAKCHLSEALPGTGVPGVPPLTEAVHSLHADVMDPVLNITLDNSANRSACYRCHPGSTTKCLRGAMGAAIATDGTMAMQCQSCHGSMSTVGSTNRVGWLMEPNCQSCHTGTATDNNGQIRYMSSFESDGEVRAAVNNTFATTPDTPADGMSLYRFSSGHGGLQCSACHGSTHAEFPATHRNDNLRNEQLQGHAGTTVECTSCHTSTPRTFTGGPHGLHPVGDTDFAVKRDGSEQWFHGEAAEDDGPGVASCQACHGADYRGTVLSRAQADRVIDTEEYGVKRFWRGYQIGCYDCHNGPDSEAPTPNHPPGVANFTTNTLSGAPVSFALQAIDADANPMTFRIVSQAIHGTVGLSNNIGTYFPEAGFVGTEQFMFAARDGLADSNLGTGTVAVAQGPFSIQADAMVPNEWPAECPAPFGVLAAPENISAPVAFDWDFGDNSPRRTNQHTTHVFSQAGTFEWRVISSVESGGISAAVTNTGLITITKPWKVGLRPVGDSLEIVWPGGVAEAVLEQSPVVGSAAEWTVSTNVVTIVSGNAVLIISNDVPAKFFRLRGP